MAAHQARHGSVSVCLTGGDLANAVYDVVARLAGGDSSLKPGEVSLWWNWDLFVSTDDPRRNSLQALSRLAGVLPLDPAKIHPMSSASTASDPEAAAIAYGVEVASADIDISLVEMTACGKIANIPAHLLPQSANPVVAMPDADPPKLIMTNPGLSATKEMWILASGTASAECLARIAAGDPSLPATYFACLPHATWMVDQEAASLLPFHECRL
jgi:6-phosphogluconolactonase